MLQVLRPNAPVEEESPEEEEEEEEEEEGHRTRQHQNFCVDTRSMITPISLYR